MIHRRILSHRAWWRPRLAAGLACQFWVSENPVFDVAKNLPPSLKEDISRISMSGLGLRVFLWDNLYRFIRQLGVRQRGRRNLLQGSFMGGFQRLSVRTAEVCCYKGLFLLAKSLIYLLWTEAPRPCKACCVKASQKQRVTALKTHMSKRLTDQSKQMGIPRPLLIVWQKNARRVPHGLQGFRASKRNAANCIISHRIGDKMIFLHVAHGVQPSKENLGRYLHHDQP